MSISTSGFGVVKSLSPAKIEFAPLTKLLDDAAVKFADRPAIDFGDVKLNYAELDALVSKVATGLQQLGVQKGVQVGLFLPNTHCIIRTRLSRVAYCLRKSVALNVIFLRPLIV